MYKLIVILLAGITSVVSFSALAKHNPEHNSEPVKATSEKPAEPAEASVEISKDNPLKAGEKKQHGKDKKSHEKKKMGKEPDADSEAK